MSESMDKEGLDKESLDKESLDVGNVLEEGNLLDVLLFNAEGMAS